MLVLSLYSYDSDEILDIISFPETNFNTDFIKSDSDFLMYVLKDLSFARGINYESPPLHDRVFPCCSSKRYYIYLLFPSVPICS